MNTEKTFRIPSDNVFVVNSLLEKFSRKVSRMGLPLITWRIETGIIHSDLTVSYPEIKLGNWEVIGMIEPLNSLVSSEDPYVYSRGDIRNKNLVSSFNSESITEYDHWDCSCEHCGINRSRKRMFILQNGEMNRKVVGSSCVKEFVGIDIGNILAFYTMLNSFEKVCRGYSSRLIDGFSFETYCERICAVIETVNGGSFRVNGKDYEVSYESSTKFNVCELGMGIMSIDFPSSEFTSVHSKNIMERLLELKGKRELNEFEKKIMLFFDVDFMPCNKVGLLVGFVGSYFRAVSELSSKKYNPANSKFIGSVGDKVSMVIGIESASSYENEWGGGIRISGWEIGTDNMITWFASGDVSSFLLYSHSEQKYNVLAESFEISCTIKHHSVHEKYGNKTIITRCRMNKKKNSKKDCGK